jgi:Poly-beta-hydroxybutyrate polymerase (PhaC) N-terminus
MNNPVPVEYVSSFTQANQSLMLHLATELLGEGGRIGDFQRFAELAQVQQDYVQQMGTLWLNTMMQSATESIQPGKGDRRFASEDWQKSPFHDFLKQSYLINARYVNRLIDRAAGDERTRRRLSFFARQVLDALSPSNYLAGNPQSLRLAMETGGESLATGIRNLIDDIGKGRISLTDEKAFEVSGNLAITPGSVIFENELIQVIQYQPLTDTVRERPLVMIPPAINKFYVLDLQPANSFVRYAVEQGHTVFMVSWRNVGADQGHLTWDDYLDLGIMRAIDMALAVTGVDKVCPMLQRLLTALCVLPRMNSTHAARIALRDRAPESNFRGEFSDTETKLDEGNTAISRHFERGPLYYALETDWLAGAEGFEPLHLRIGIAKTLHSGREDSSIRISIEVCRAAPHSQRKSQAMIDNSGSNSEMQKFESSRLKRPVRV